MKKIRLLLMIRLYESSSRIYAGIFKAHKKAWAISKEELAAYDAGTLGKALGDFYVSNGFDVMPKLENHDAFHVLTGTGTAIHDEIALQYLLLGNGKLSLYLFAMICIGSILYPEHLANFRSHYQKGRRCQPFHGLDFHQLLGHSLEMLQSMLIVKTTNIHI